MSINNRDIMPLIEFIKIDKYHVSCSFKCSVTNRSVISVVPFEPYEGKIEFTWKEILLHPILSYNRYYHTPITIFGNNCHETIILKAFEKVAQHFVWDEKENKYVYN